MLKKSSSYVLASCHTRDAYLVKRRSFVRGKSADLPVERRVLARRGEVGENRGLFEHPDVTLAFAPYRHFQPYCWHKPSVSAAYQVWQTH
jgi:hypothetical protein